VHSKIYVANLWQEMAKTQRFRNLLPIPKLPVAFSYQESATLIHKSTPNMLW